ncbi:type II toxin-antitoxin system RelE/ParE family toxin [Rhizobium sp. BK602]|uniref:type II toxin-antitoxin system RelE/ParE family toxin n=1 Tax=Rhizobium sp. BK602 TaxID=2586986 RepID=UPI001615685A|nr:type II toxin-antitoxin system RelE/ParE family toxin [Rhizobium sp. BK602]MBB3612049.1 plasmid stabilization system protein ParE [Rhizobium sp. BK602]
MKVAISDAAYNDLTAIGRAIAKHNPERALSFMDELHNACFELGEMPYAFAELAMPDLNSVRRRPYGNYLIFYEIEDTTIYVSRVLHGARNYPRILRGKTGG